MIEAPEGMTDAQMWALIVGFFVPLVLNFIVKATWPSWVKSICAFVFSAIVGGITAWFAGAFTGLSVISTILLVLVVAITSYQLFWKQIAPNMQRGSAEKTRQDVVAANEKIAAVATPVAKAAAEHVVEELPAAHAVVIEPGGIVIQGPDGETKSVG